MAAFGANLPKNLYTSNKIFFIKGRCNFPYRFSLFVAFFSYFQIRYKDTTKKGLKSMYYAEKLTKKSTAIQSKANEPLFFRTH